MVCIRKFLILLSISLSFQAISVADGQVSFPKGTWKGTWSTPDHPDQGGELTVKLGFFSKMTFEDVNLFYSADKACKKSAKLPTKKSGGAYKLENPFRIDLKGRCGPITVTISVDENNADKYRFEFVRDRYMLQPLIGEITVLH